MGKTFQSMVIDEQVDRVWHATRDFHDLSRFIDDYFCTAPSELYSSRLKQEVGP